MTWALLVESCGKTNSGSTTDHASAESKWGPLVPVQVYIQETPGSSGPRTSLALAAPGSVDADSYTMTLGGCASGLTGTVTAGTVNVYKFDTGCLLKLTAFVLHGTSYSITSNFTTWLANDTATFTGSGTVANLQVVSQLSSPINVADVVSYNFRFNVAGTNSSTLTVGNAQTIYASGQDAPAFNIQSGGSFYNSMTGGGIGQFTFNLTCTAGAMTGGVNNSRCAGPGGAVGSDILSNFSYKLILDASGVGTLTLANAIAAFSTAGTSPVVGDKLGGNLGFATQTLNGPGQMATAANSKMLLVLMQSNSNATYTSNAAYSSFQYFPVTYTSVTP